MESTEAADLGIVVLCWICRRAIGSARQPKHATGLCERCYAREYQRAKRDGSEMVRTPADAIRLGRKDLIDLAQHPPAQPPAVLTRLQKMEGMRLQIIALTDQQAQTQEALDQARAEIRKIQRAGSRLLQVAEAARAWWRSPFLIRNQQKLKDAVEAYQRSLGAPASRAID